MSIICSQCQTENPSDSKYCKECASLLLPPEKIEVTETLEAPKEELTAGSAFAGRYEIVEELGKGGMGRVYRAFDNKVEEEIALKLLKPEIAVSKKTIKRFRNELKLARRITHKNVCRMFDFHEEEKIPFITMEYVQGESLKAFIQKQEILPEEKAINIAQQICKGLSEAHELGIVHRDLKPQNIMMDLEGNAKIMDFGIAHFFEAEGVTQTGMIVGTPDYMSPEQAEGKKADPRSDIYSLGIILYEMVTGKVPLKGDTALSIAMKHKTEPPLDPRKLNEKVSENLSSVILKCLEKDREERFQSVDELLDELKNIEEGLPLTTEIKRSPLPAFLIEGEEIEMERAIFVAREEELTKLEGFLDQALSGKGQVVFVKGEAGSGKTALIQEFARRAQDKHPELIVAGGNCNAHTGIGDPYLPFREVLALLTGDVEGRWKAGSISTDHARRLWDCLPLMAQSLLDCGSELIDTFVSGQELLGRAKSYEGSSSSKWLGQIREIVKQKVAIPADPTLQQSVLFKQYARVLEVVAEKKPIFMIVDDLQWADAGSTSLLMHLAERFQNSRILIAGAYRPEEIALGRDGEPHPLRPIINECKATFGDIEVEVGLKGGQEFVNAYLDNEPNCYSSVFRESFLKHTEGHSLFTIEVLRGLKEQRALVQDNDGRWTESIIEWEKLPNRVEALIGQRIDRLPKNFREILTVASIEGEYFTGEVLAGVQKSDEREMIRLLSGELDKRYQLVRAQGIQHAGGQRLSQYRFQHILFQKYLYNSLDDVERAHLHEDLGNAMENLYGKQAGEISGQLARHFQEAGLADKAIQYMQKAGAKAIQLSANEEAITHFGKALELLKTLPRTPERLGQDLALQTPMAYALMNLRGYADPKVGEAFTRAHELCRQIGEIPDIAPVLNGLWAYYFTKGELEPAIELAGQILRLVSKAKDPTVLALIGHNAQAANHSVMGNFNSALVHAQQAIAVYDYKKHRSLIFLFTQDVKSASESWLHFDLWMLGYPDQGRQRLEEALAFARELDHPHTLSFALCFAILFYQFCQDVQAVRELIHEAMELCTEYGFLMWKVYMMVYHGWVLTEEGKPEEGIMQIRQGLAIKKPLGARTLNTHNLTILARAHVKAGQIEEGLSVLEEGLDAIEDPGERFYLSEIHRLKGEFLLMKGAKDVEAEEHYIKAIDIAQGQKAKSLELRATMSLARLWLKQGKKEEAHKKLAEIDDWFTEGFDTQDLKDAKALLEELSE